MTIAPALAHYLHCSQVDKCGVPYIYHLRRVVKNLIRRWPDSSQDEIDAAWLHDALEDTDIGTNYLLDRGISTRTVSIVQKVTRRRDLSYMDWIRDIAASGDLSAIKVKLADNEDNSDLARVAALGKAGIVLFARRYAPAKLILEAGYESAKAAQGGS